MIPDWTERFLGATGIAEYDPRSAMPVAWGRQVIEEIPEDLFEDLRSRCEMACIFPNWFLIERRVQFADLLMQHGGLRAVGVGPGGGFKWVRFSDGSTWGHPSFKTGALKEVELRPRLVVKCDKDGNEAGQEPRIPRRAVGRPGRSGRKK